MVTAVECLFLIGDFLHLSKVPSGVHVNRIIREIVLLAKHVNILTSYYINLLSE
jgi:hypothetical protein